jgi:DNA invertase Pin-like site-specific DNA recombinase
MKTKLSPESIRLIFTMHAAGHPAENIADAADCSYSTVIRYLNAAGIVLGNHGGRPRLVTDEYMALAADMRAKGQRWIDVEYKTGFHRSTFQARLRAERASA